MTATDAAVVMALSLSGLGLVIDNLSDTSENTYFPFAFFRDPMTNEVTGKVERQTAARSIRVTLLDV